jgi:hypothetical protein
MATIRQEARLELERRELVTLGAAGPQTLLCETGEVWITLDGGGADLFLRAGEALRLAGAAGTVVSALRPSTLRLTADGPLARICDPSRGRAPWLWARRLRWKFPALSALPAVQLR